MYVGHPPGLHRDLEGTIFDFDQELHIAVASHSREVGTCVRRGPQLLEDRFDFHEFT